jgi:hypothetical protein
MLMLKRPLKASRERQMKFMGSFGRPDNVIRAGVCEMLAIYGTSWLTDEQMGDIVENQVSAARFSQRLNIRNRKLRRA